MNKTSIIMSVDKSYNSYDVIKQIILHDITVFRFDLNIFDHDFCRSVINIIRKCDKELGTNSAIMFDTVGPICKTGTFTLGNATFTEGMKIRVYNNSIVGDCTKLYIDYYDLIDGIRCNTLIKLNGGKVVLQVIDKEADYLLCEVIVGGEVVDYSSVFIDEDLRLPFLSNKDREDIIFANEMNVDFLGLSMVNSSEDVLDVNDLLIELGNDHISIISKIERESAIREIDDIIRVSDGILLARNELSIDVPIERIPGILKMVINKCHYSSKISIVTSDILCNFDVNNGASVSDISNVILEGSDAILLLSDNNFNNFEELTTINKIISACECDIDYDSFLGQALRSDSGDITGGISYSVVSIANSLKCKAILVPTISGYTARRMSRFRPSCPIIAMSPDINTVKSLKLYFGVIPIYIKELKSLDEIIIKSREVALEYLGVESPDKIVITGGYPFRKTKHTNFMKIEEM